MAPVRRYQFHDVTFFGLPRSFVLDALIWRCFHMPSACRRSMPRSAVLMQHNLHTMPRNTGRCLSRLCTQEIYLPVALILPKATFFFPVKSQNRLPQPRKSEVELLLGRHYLVLRETRRRGAHESIGYTMLDIRPESPLYNVSFFVIITSSMPLPEVSVQK